MSDLYRSAMSARLAKLPLDLPPSEEDDEDETVDFLGSLPGEGMGPPAMQVNLPIYAPSVLISDAKGLHGLNVSILNVGQLSCIPPFLPPPSLKMQLKSPYLRASSTAVYTIRLRSSPMERL